MADPENQGSTAQSDPAPEGKSGSGGSGGDIGLSMAYIMSIPGILKIVEFVCIFLLQNKASLPPPEFLLVVLIRNVGGDWRDEFVYVSSVATATSTLHQGLLFWDPISDLIGRYYRCPRSPQTWRQDSYRLASSDGNKPVLLVSKEFRSHSLTASLSTRG